MMELPGMRTDGTGMADIPCCVPCDRSFSTEVARAAHQVAVHGDHARDFTAQQRKSAAKAGAAMPDGSFPIKNVEDLKNAIQAYGRAKNKSAVKAHIISRAKALGATNLLPQGWGTTEKAELMHSCEPCSRPFAEERSLFQHATAVHGYDESADRAAKATVLGAAGWQDGERRLVVAKIDGARVIRDEAEPVERAQALAHVMSQTAAHGSTTTISGLSCGSCSRSFQTVRALTDHAASVHDSALDATYSEREQLVSAALRNLRDGLGTRIWAYICDMTDTDVVYQVDGNDNLFQSKYTINADGTVDLGDPVAVRRRTVYETVGNN